MKFKKLMFMLALAIVILGAAGVCASDVNNTVIARGDDSAIELSQSDAGEMMSLKEGELIGQTENDDVISEGDVGTFAELQGNITAAKPGSTLTLTKNYGWESGFDIEGIIIGKSMTIDGNGFKIDAKEKSRIFKITADNVMLKNIIFTNGKTTGNGGAAFFEKSGAVINCNFSNNFNDGGSVFFAGKGEVTYCNFFDNYAAYGGAVYFSDLGTLANCNFTDNTATKDGGAVYFQNTGDVRNCNFIASTSKNNGGALFFEKSATVTNCNFTGSTASNTGGAVYFSGDGELTNCSLADNTATKYGGAVYFSGDGEVTNCSFANNTAKMGNAIYNSNHCTVCDSDFTNNPLTKGAIHSVTGDITFSNNVLDADDVVRGRNFTEIQKLIDLANEGDEITVDGLYTGFGIPIRITKSLTLTGQNNATLDAKKLSKILYITADNVIIKNIQFTRGRAENEGAVYFYRTGTVTNCNFTDNEVIGEKGSGGAIYFNGAGNVIDSIFTDNRATRNGGAIYVEAQSINNNFSSQLYNNYAGQSGGAIFFHNLVQNNSFECIFRDNYAGYGGGMFFSKNANENRFSSDFINNTAKSCGGAMFFYSTTDRNNFTGRFINNSALGQIDPTNGNGGAITFKNVSTNSIFSSEFINNIAALNGGAVNYRETPRNIIFNTNFTNNTAQRGGGVNFFKTFEDVIFNGEFIGNSAENGGALAAGYGTIEDISFKNNHANNGGAVYLAGSGSTVNCNFTNNRATRNGGAVYISEKGNVVNCSFENNTAAHDGGAVYSKFGTVEDCNFTGNDASNDGGAVSLSYPSNVANCHFADNSAKNGGALYFLNDNDNVINCSFVANEATGRGGAVFFMTNQQVNATNCYFEGNSAPEGGAIFCYTWAVTADSIILKTDSDTTNNTLILSPKLEVYDFYSVYGSGENLTFYLTTHGGMPITNGNISMAVYLKDNAKQVFNHTFLSGTDWTVDLPVGYYYAFINTEYEEFEPIFRTIEITMPDVQFYVNVTSLTTNRNTVNITAKSNIPKNLLWDGKLIFILSNGTQINATYGVNGTWWAEYTFDDCGEYDVSASYVGLDNVAVNNGTITIYKEDSTITLDNIVLDYGDSRNVTVTTTGATGITANIDSVNVTVINNFTIRISGLKAGNHTLTVTTIADSIHNPVTKEVNITVNKVESTLTVGDIVFDYGSEGSGDVSFTGASEVIANVVNQSSAVVSVSGNKISVSGLAAGTYTLNVTTVPDENHTAVTETAGITVNKVNSTLTLDDVVLDYGESKNITVATEGATGITAKIDGVNVTVNGYTIPISGLGAGNYTLSVTTIPDDNHNPVTVTSKITVNKVESTLTVGDIVFDYGSEGSGDVSFTGASEVLANVVNQSSAVVSVSGNKISVSGLAAGTYTLNVTTVPDENHTAVTETAGITVNKINSTLTLDDVVLDYGESKNITVTTGGATGITAKIDGVNVTVNNYSIPISGLGAGNYTLTVKTIADKNHNPVTKEANITVNKLSTEIILANETLDLKVNDEFAVLANLTPAGAGNLSYSSNNESVVKVSDDGLITALSKGSATVTVSFAGNDNYAAAQNKTISVTVSLKDTGISVLNDTVSIVIDEVYEIGAVVVPENLTVNYTSSNPEVAGVDNGVVTGLKEGSAVITLTVGDDKVYKKSTAAVSVTVFKVPTEIIVNKATLELFVGDVASDVASLKPSTGDNLTYISNDSSVVKFEGSNLVAVANGTAAITVSYDGNDKYEAANSKVIEVTVSLKDASVSAEDIELNVGDNATIVPVTVPDGLNVTYEADDSGVVTVEDDVVTAVKEGTAKITLTVGGDGVYAENSTTITVTVSKILTVVSGKNYSQYAVDYYAGERGQNFTVQLKDANGNPVANKTVSFALSGKILNRTTDANGYARLQINLKDVNKLPVTVTFEGDEKYTASSASYVITINKKPITITAAAKTYKATAKTKKYTVTLKTIKGSSANGKIYLKSGKKVTLKLNGKTYTAKTNSKGQATFSLKITKKGKFTAVVKFAGDKTYKAATKKPKITIK